MFTDVSVG